MLIKKSMLAAAFALVTAALTTPAHADALDSIMAAKVIKVAVPQDFAPFGSAGLDLKPQGYDIDMANLIGKALGVKVEIIAVTSANRIPYLQTKKADIVISSLGKNAEREKVIDFSVAYAPFFSGVFGTKEIKVASADELKGKTIGATRGAIEEQELTKLAPADTTIKRFEDNNATIAAFVSGQVDLIATGNTVAAAIAEKVPARAPALKFVIKDSPCFIGLNKEEPKLLAKLNDIIAQAKTSGDIAKLSEKWLKAPLPPGF
ncbi:transporter substrate-binding domain-containing protein [Bradyrhizobium sp. AUGA SZCCT0240]|jgi:polar amino acid transport system substrate-binding protein|nr:transporter substrate-binding domain-containing protein [Bradyrhizobium sp. AUGA SZCCT0158]MBR1242604.1 transporter substrate-binding domain-containing protein [Bradyrhizobium sp. AUGA SZCCT0274]MBR1252410.1 transporter substrate-binding domain-containing protein [Bradyrhizobium sp. AUGA SZCCT0240]